MRRQEIGVQLQACGPTRRVRLFVRLPRTAKPRIAEAKVLDREQVGPYKSVRVRREGRDPGLLVLPKEKPPNELFLRSRAHVYRQPIPFEREERRFPTRASRVSSYEGSARPRGICPC